MTEYTFKDEQGKEATARDIREILQFDKFDVLGVSKSAKPEDVMKAKEKYMANNHPGKKPAEFDNLVFPRDATQEDLARFKRLYLARNHPDRFPGDAAKLAKFAEANAAWARYQDDLNAKDPGYHQRKKQAEDLLEANTALKEARDAAASARTASERLKQSEEEAQKAPDDEDLRKRVRENKVSEQLTRERAEKKAAYYEQWVLQKPHVLADADHAKAHEQWGEERKQQTDEEQKTRRAGQANRASGQAPPNADQGQEDTRRQHTGSRGGQQGTKNGQRQSGSQQDGGQQRGGGGQQARPGGQRQRTGPQTPPNAGQGQAGGNNGQQPGGQQPGGQQQQARPGGQRQRTGQQAPPNAGQGQAGNNGQQHTGNGQQPGGQQAGGQQSGGQQSGGQQSGGQQSGGQRQQARPGNQGRPGQTGHQTPPNSGQRQAPTSSGPQAGPDTPRECLNPDGTVNIEKLRQYNARKAQAAAAAANASRGGDGLPPPTKDPVEAHANKLLGGHHATIMELYNLDPDKHVLKHTEKALHLKVPNNGDIHYSENKVDMKGKHGDHSYHATVVMVGKLWGGAKVGGSKNHQLMAKAHGIVAGVEIKTKGKVPDAQLQKKVAELRAAGYKPVALPEAKTAPVRASTGSFSRAGRAMGLTA
ncbi:MAG: hypothetical protein M3N08_06490 [Pseudomonadota bacterium]|nr:hypothetical protein [Pseudomonadota bacterium]